MSTPDIPDITEILARRIAELEDQLNATREELELQRSARAAAEKRVDEQEALMLELLATVGKGMGDADRARLDALSAAQARVAELEAELALVATLRRSVAAALVERDIATTATTGEYARLMSVAIFTPDDPELPPGQEATQ